MNFNKNNKTKQRNKNLYYGSSFLSIIIIIYLILSFFDPEKIYRSLHTSLDIIIQILPILVLVIFIMGVANYFLKPKTVSKYLGEESGFKGWFLAIAMGILSSGPIYVWYSLLKDLRAHGMRTGLISVFLYNRAIKIPLLPVMIFYFGIGFVFILSLYMIIASVMEGKIIETIECRFSKQSREDV